MELVYKDVFLITLEPQSLINYHTQYAAKKKPSKIPKQMDLWILLETLCLLVHLIHKAVE